LNPPFPGNRQLAKETIIGVWVLISGEFCYSNGTASRPWGNKPVGQLIYTENGYMSVQIMNPDRPFFVSKDHYKGTGEEIRKAFEGYQAYFGTYSIDEKESSITHYVIGSVFPNLTGKPIKRFYELDGSTLTLKTPPMKMGGEIVTGILVWTKLLK